MPGDKFLTDMPVEKDGLVLIGYGNGANTKQYTALVDKDVLERMEEARVTGVPGYQIADKTKGKGKGALLDKK